MFCYVIMDKSRQYIDKRHKRLTIDNTHASFSSPQNPNTVGIRISNYPKPRQKTSIYFLHQSTTQEEIEPFEDQDEPLELDEAARIPDALTRSHAGNDSFSQTVLKIQNIEILSSLPNRCSITRAVTNERIINPALERTYLGAN